MSQINCLRCKEPIDENVEQCPHCSERVTAFQRTYSGKLLDGKYQIIDRLGVGGMGEIFKVRHIHLNELRVIKIMRPNVASDEQGLQRFLQEARTSTMIKHKNLAMLYDFAQLDDGSYYMVWEFIDGTNIQKWIAQTGPMPARLTVEIAVQALHGLDHLHSMGLIHRDISPENIMLSQDHHGKLLVKVIDFGIAKQLAEGDGGQGLTQTGMFLGKLKYASPEQAGFLKEGEHLDARSDLYSFGIVLYEMLAGRAPFQATNPHGYILKHVTEKPVPIAELNPGANVPPQLEAVIMRSLEKSRDVRFADAAEFAAALESIRSSIPPDAKYGVGERMVTLSGAKTLADLPKMTAPATTLGGAQPTQQTFAGATVVKPGSKTVAASDEATLMERQLTSTSTRAGAEDATVMERLGAGAAPTALESKLPSGGSQAEATVLERKLAHDEDAPQKKTALIAAAAAIVVMLIAVGGYFATRKGSAPPVATTTAPADAGLTSTAPANPLPVGQGVLLLSASPWADIEKIVSKSDQREIELGDNLYTPARIQLAPGDYSVTLRGDGDLRTIDVKVLAGQPTTQHVQMSNVDLNKLTQEVTRP
jgi:serine/threonine protein kinase